MSYVQSASANTGSATSPASLTITLATTSAPGRLLLLTVASAATVPTPTGWTSDAVEIGDVSLYLFRKVSSGEQFVTFAVSDRAAATLAEYDDVLSASPIDQNIGATTLQQYTWSQDWESVPNGAQPTVANTASPTSDAITSATIHAGDTLTGSTADWAHTATSLAVQTGVASTGSYVTYTLQQAVTTAYCRMYVKIPAWGSTTVKLLQLMSGSTQVGAIAITVDGTVQFQVVGSANAVQLTPAVTAGQWCRIEMKIVCDPVVGSIEGRFYSSPDSTAVTQSGTATNLNTGSNITSFQIGGHNASNVLTYVDDVVFDATNWPGPYSTGQVVSTFSPGTTGPLAQGIELCVAAWGSLTSGPAGGIWSSPTNGYTLESSTGTSATLPNVGVGFADYQSTGPSANAYGSYLRPYGPVPNPSQTSTASVSPASTAVSILVTYKVTGGVPYGRTVSDSVGIAETAAQVADTRQSVTESTGLTDPRIIEATGSAEWTDPVFLTEPSLLVEATTETTGDIDLTLPVEAIAIVDTRDPYAVGVLEDIPDAVGTTDAEIATPSTEPPTAWTQTIHDIVGLTEPVFHEVITPPFTRTTAITQRRVWLLPAVLAYAPGQPVPPDLYVTLGLTADSDDLSLVPVGNFTYAVEAGRGAPIIIGIYQGTYVDVYV